MEGSFVTRLLVSALGQMAIRQAARAGEAANEASGPVGQGEAFSAAVAARTLVECLCPDRHVTNQINMAIGSYASRRSKN